MKLFDYDLEPSTTDPIAGWTDKNTGKNYRIFDADGNLIITTTVPEAVAEIVEHVV